MAVKTKNAKGFGARYGRKIREKIGRYIELKNTKKKCPYCHSMKAKRISAGIWNCRKCLKKFTGRAYEIGEVSIKEEILEEKEM